MNLKPISIIAAVAALISCGNPEDAAQTPAEVLLDRLEGLVEEGKLVKEGQRYYLSESEKCAL